ncbi:hypothetical protein [Streptomyces niveus]|uniref:hypothetical protein n=1 Tax=Streptomyces niveus TaxID=193462 RepID=UPI0003C5C0C1|nr:hypothetical protein [Streptomyces niveus]EST18147.1 hypothetical protein M877_39680 [Streptomyces niveus NCIMB 11891]
MPRPGQQKPAAIEKIVVTASPDIAGQSPQGTEPTATIRDAQLRLHQAGAAYRRLCQALPSPVEPAPGWEGDKQPYTEYHTGKPDSPGYTPEQKSEKARLRGEALQLLHRPLHAPVLADPESRHHD